ncbi:hypothetical protein JQC72_02950 [Polycladomyces sp. WAk]|uniref:Secreted protein n=1 Tax=Polycladomyces zharkentensis TaxID=2807616 RepID=A0ABS2WG35_9BACL|nr:hypothetical protein [Polycladomyces sp. WAk]MBN2908476.1 hypothetical protein [Polycladomyces sp. WAk]
MERFIGSQSPVSLLPVCLAVAPTMVCTPAIFHRAGPIVWLFHYIRRPFEMLPFELTDAQPGMGVPSPINAEKFLDTPHV